MWVRRPPAPPGRCREPSARAAQVLEHPELFPRLVFGSDYPIPALGGRIIGTRPQPLALLHGGAFRPQVRADPMGVRFMVRLPMST